MKSFKIVLLLFLVIVFTNCNNDDPIEETPEVVINEVLPKNQHEKNYKTFLFNPDWNSMLICDNCIFNQ